MYDLYYNNRNYVLTLCNNRNYVLTLSYW